MRPVAPHVLQVVVLPSGPHAALAVGHAAPQRHLAAGVHRAQQHWLELSQNQNRLGLEQNQNAVKLAASLKMTVKPKLDSHVRHGTRRYGSVIYQLLSE